MLSQPTLEQVIGLHASPTAQDRMRYLLDVNRNGRLTDVEHAEFELFFELDHFVQNLKIRARQKMRDTQCKEIKNPLAFTG